MKKAMVLGGHIGSPNIAGAIGNRLLDDGWAVHFDDCAVTGPGGREEGGDLKEGYRPPGGNLPDSETAREHGYEGDPHRYVRYDAPAVQTFEKFDPHALVITLGKTYKGHIAEIKEHEIRDILRANLELPLIAARRFVQAMEAKHPGIVGVEPERRQIVFTGSYAHRHPFTNGTLYCAAKAGLHMAAQTLGWELTDRGFRVFIVHPFHVQGTPMWEEVEEGVMTSKGLTREEAVAYTRKDLKMPDLLTAEEVAEVVSTLLNVPAMEWLSGTAVELNGGSR